MTQIHVVIRRINPALKVDLVQVGYLKDGNFVQLPLGALKDGPFSRFLKSSGISDSPYIDHSDISSLLSVLSGFTAFCVEFFDNTLVLMFDYNLTCDESAPEEEGKGN